MERIAKETLANIHAKSWIVSPSNPQMMISTDGKHAVPKSLFDSIDKKVEELNIERGIEEQE